MPEYIDTRDLLEELRSLVGGDENYPDPNVVNELDESELERVNDIRDLLDEIGDEAQYGVALVPESDFTEYAQELAEDIGAIDCEAAWPYTCIDWEWAAAELRHDYSCITFDGVDYLYQA